MEQETFFAQKIKRNYTSLLRRIYPADIVPELFEKDMLSRNERNDIQAMDGDGKKNTKLLEILENKPDNVYDKFIEVLKKLYPDVAKAVEKTQCDEAKIVEQGFVQRLCRNYGTLLDRVRPYRILPYLYQYGGVSRPEHNVITSIESDKDQVAVIIKILLRKTSKEYGLFRESLLSEYPDLVNNLDTTEIGSYPDQDCQQDVVTMAALSQSTRVIVEAIQQIQRQTEQQHNQQMSALGMLCSNCGMALNPEAPVDATCLMAVLREEQKLIMIYDINAGKKKNEHYEIPEYCFVGDSHACIAVDGKIYFIGGKKVDNTPSGTVCAFDIKGGFWQKLTSMHGEKYAKTVFDLNGFIYTIGGRDNTGRLATVERYDIKKNVWSVMNDLPDAYSGSSSCTMDGVGYVFGGYNHDDLNSDLLRYNEAEDLWETLITFQIPRRDHILCGADGKIFAIGGLGYGDDDPKISAIECWERGRDSTYFLDSKLIGSWWRRWSVFCPERGQVFCEPGNAENWLYKFDLRTEEVMVVCNLKENYEDLVLV